MSMRVFGNLSPDFQVIPQQNRNRTPSASIPTQSNYSVIEEFLSLFKDVPPPILIKRLPDESDWLKIDEEYHYYLQEKERLSVSDHIEEVFYAEDGSRNAGEEIIDLIIKRFPDYFKRNGNIIENCLTGQSWDLNDKTVHPLFIAGMLVQEDFCLTKLDGNEYKLIAASLHFPSGWKLHEKLGKSLAEIHEGMPGYKENLEESVDKLAINLKATRTGIRFNPLIFEAPTLFQPTRQKKDSIPYLYTQDNVSNETYIRIERQIFKRLPKNNDYILFTIRPYILPLKTVEKYRDFAGELLKAYKRVLPTEKPDLKKGINDFRSAALSYLQDIAGKTG